MFKEVPPSWKWGPLLSKCAARCCWDGESGLNGGGTRWFQAFEKAVWTNQTGDYPFHRRPPRQRADWGASLVASGAERRQINQLRREGWRLNLSHFSQTSVETDKMSFLQTSNQMSINYKCYCQCVYSQSRYKDKNSLPGLYISQYLTF